MATVKYSPYKGVFTEGDVITATLDWFDEAEELYFVWAFGLGVYEPMDYKTAVDAGAVTVSGRTVTLKRLVKDEEDARKVFVFRRSLLKTAAEQTSLDAIPLAAMLAELEELRRCAEDAKVEAEKALRVPEDDQDTTHFTDRETRAGQIAGFDDRGNPAVGKAVRQIQEIYELFDKMLALYEEMKETFEAFKGKLLAWEAELKAWAEGFRGDMEKLYDETMNVYEDVKAIYEKLKDWERLFEERWESYREELYAEWKTYLNGIRAEWESKLSQIDAEWKKVLSGYDVEWKGVLAAYDAEWKKILAAYEVEFSELFKKYEALWNENVEAFKAWAEAKKQEILEWESNLKRWGEDFKGDIEQWGNAFKQELAEWKAAFEQELAAWKDELLKWEEALKKWAEDFQKRMEALYDELRQYRYQVITREEYDLLLEDSDRLDDGMLYLVKGTFDVGYVFYDLLKEYFPDIILPIENGPFEEDVDLRRVARLDKFNVFKTANRFLYQSQMLEAPTDPLHLVRLCDLEDWEGGGGGDKGFLVAKVFDDVVPTTGAAVGKDENGYLRMALAGTSKAGAVRLALSVDDAGGVMTAEKTKEAIGSLEEKVASNFAKFEAGTSTAETGAKHGKSLLASQNGEDGGFYVGSNRSATRAWTQYMTRYRQTGVRAYGATNGEYEDYLWAPRTEGDEPLRVARMKDFDRIVNPTLVVSTEGEKTEDPDENANITAWIGTLGALKGLEEDDATAIVPDAVSVWRRTKGTTVNGTLNMRMKIMRWDEASGAWAIAAKSKETRIWNNFADGEEIKFTFAWDGDGIPANEKIIIGFVRMNEEDVAGTFTQASCAQTTTRSGSMTVAPGLSTREPAVQEYAPVMRLGTARVLTPADIDALIAGAGTGGVSEAWVEDNFMPLSGGNIEGDLRIGYVRNGTFYQAVGLNHQTGSADFSGILTAQIGDFANLRVFARNESGAKVPVFTANPSGVSTSLNISTTGTLTAGSVETGAVNFTGDVGNITAMDDGSLAIVGKTINIAATGEGRFINIRSSVLNFTGGSIWMKHAGSNQMTKVYAGSIELYTENSAASQIYVKIGDGNITATGAVSATDITARETLTVGNSGYDLTITEGGNISGVNSIAFANGSSSFNVSGGEITIDTPVFFPYGNDIYIGGETSEENYSLREKIADLEARIAALEGA